ncbi:MAG: DUF5666 domain-containing protein [Candidatus Electrothrix sp. YB6]
MNSNYTKSPRHSAAGKMITGALFALAVILTCLFCAGAAQTSRDEGDERSGERRKIYGLIDRMPDSGFTGIWVVGGREVEITERTQIKEEDGRAETGQYVKVEGAWNGNRFTAYELEVEDRRAYRDGRMDSVKMFGTIEALPRGGFNGVWRVSGWEVTVDRNTRIKEEHGRVVVGAYAEVKGRATGDNTFIAYEIDIKNNRR